MPTIELPENVIQILRNEVAAGRFHAEADVVAAALELLRSHQCINEEMPRDFLDPQQSRDSIAKSQLDVAAGRVFPFDEALSKLGRS